MNTTQRFVLYFIAGSIFVSFLTFANYQRLQEHNRFYARVKLTTDSCMDLMKSLEEIENIPEDLVSSAQGTSDVSNDINVKIRAASGPIVQVTPRVMVNESESSLEIVRVSISINRQVTLAEILGIVGELTKSRQNKPSLPFTYFLDSLVLVDEDGKPTIKGQSETWKCTELILSCICKADKSP